MVAAPWVHPKTGTLYYRKVLPERARHLFGGKREVRRSLKTRNVAEARLRHAQIAAEVEAKIAAASISAHGLPHRELMALAGAWYRRELAKHEAEPGTAREWEAIAETYKLDLEAAQALDRRQRGVAVGAMDGEDDDPAADWLAVRPELCDWLRADTDEADEIALSHGYRLDPASANRLYSLVFRNALRLFGDMAARANGNYGLADRLATFPAVAGAVPSATSLPVTAPAEVAFASIIAAWAEERQPQPKTRYTVKVRVGLLTKHLKHEDAAKVTADSLKGWHKAMIEGGCKPRTADSYFIDIKTLFTFAAAHGLLPSNPAAGLEFGRRKRKGAVAERRMPFDNDEALLILEAARKLKGAYRWIPWVLAFTGARIEEVCQALVSDIRELDGIPYLDVNIDDEGKTLKTTESARRVPLHPALIAEGFLGYVAGLPKTDKRTGKPGRLFPDLKAGSFGDFSAAYSKWAGRWVRSLGIADRRKVACHSWRHRFKDVCRDSEVRKETNDALTGHTAGDVASNYGKGPALPTLYRAICKLPLPSGLTVAGWTGARGDEVKS